MVSLEVLLAAVEAACTVTVVDPDPVSDVGLNVAVTLGPGDPVRVKFTVPTKPFEGTRAMAMPKARSHQASSRSN